MTAALLILILSSGCSSDNTDKTAGMMEDHLKGTMQLDYADQFHVSYYDDNIAIVSIEDGLRYLVTEGSDELPEWVPAEELEDMTVIEAPAHNIYIAASSAMDPMLAAGCIGNVTMTSTQASDWGIPEIKEKVENGDIAYIGKYRAPDYEALVEHDVDLAVESTMIYHTPQVKEAIEELGIPVLVERSSYENDPLGRLEWIKLYGLLTGRYDEACAFFDNAVDKIKSVNTDSIENAPSVAYFSVNSSGSVVVRKPGDYVTRMIEMAGGAYVLDGAIEPEDNALSTMNMQMEAFYENAVDADILIYNSSIEADLSTIADLTEKSAEFSDFKAVKDGNVWCTNRNVFQKTTAAADMITEMNEIFSGISDDTGMQYFHKLK